MEKIAHATGLPGPVVATGMAAEDASVETWGPITQAGAAEAQAASFDLSVLPMDFRAAADHPSFSLVRSWKVEESPLPSDVRDRGTISRQDLFDLATTVRSGDASWTTLLKVTFGWGWAGTALGPSRLRRILESTSTEVIEANLRGAIRTLDSSGAVAAYWDLNNATRYKITHLGPAFFTKFLYFAAPQGSPQGPLILDSVVAGRANRVTGQPRRLRAGNWSTQDYAFYLALMERLALTLRDLRPDEPWTADAVELALFAPWTGVA